MVNTKTEMFRVSNRRRDTRDCFVPVAAAVYALTSEVGKTMVSTATVGLGSMALWRASEAASAAERAVRFLQEHGVWILGAMLFVGVGPASCSCLLSHPKRTVEVRSRNVVWMPGCSTAVAFLSS